MNSLNRRRCAFFVQGTIDDWRASPAVLLAKWWPLR